MPVSNLLALIDDIASVLDDVAVLSKVAVKKTAGVLGDDLALNAQQVTGVTADRELPVVWAVAKGSLVNKAILVPAALLISFLAPWAITPLLMLGGLYLCFEGCEKLAHKFLASHDQGAHHHAALVAAIADPAVDLVKFEKEKIKGAIRTDFILSAEIVVITLGSLTDATMTARIGTLIAVALLMTLGVYGLVAGIVKLDDLGRYWHRNPRIVWRRLGAILLRLAPLLMKSLGVVGTAAMFLVGGGILVHGIAPLHHLLDHATSDLGGWGKALSLLSELGVGMAAGALALAAVALFGKLRSRVAVK